MACSPDRLVRIAWSSTGSPRPPPWRGGGADGGDQNWPGTALVAPDRRDPQPGARPPGRHAEPNVGPVAVRQPIAVAVFPRRLSATGQLFLK